MSDDVDEAFLDRRLPVIGLSVDQLERCADAREVRVNVFWRGLLGANARLSTVLVPLCAGEGTIGGATAG